MQHGAAYGYTYGYTRGCAMSDAPGFFDYLFGQREGWACLGWLDGDPQLGKIDVNHQEWYQLPQNRETLDRRAAWHAAQGHNLYVRQTLFSKKSGSQAAALSSPIIWQDDAQIDTPASVLIETSAGNYQALITLDRDVTTAERKRLMTAWRNARPGADTCSANPVAFVRVPGGHNRKRHGDWLVRYAVQSTRVYSAEKLLARCGAGEGGTHTPGSSGALDRAQLDHWQSHIDDLLNSDRSLPRAFVKNTLGRRILETRALGKGTFYHASGTWDASAERLCLAHSLVMARYFDEQIAALLWHFEVSETIEIKGDASIWGDIARVIGMAREAHPHIAPRLYGAKAPAAPKIARGRASNHAQTLEQVYSLLVDHRAGADAIVTIGDLAAQIGCHRRTISTILCELKTAGRIAWRRFGQRGGLVISFISDVIIEQAPATAQPTVAPEIATPGAAHGETGLQGVCVTQDHATDHSSEPPTLAELAKHYLDQRPEAIGKRLVNMKTGDHNEGTVIYRRSAQHFADLVTAEYSYTAAEARAAYKAEQQRRAELERQTWQRFFAWLRGLTDDELTTYIAGRARASLRGVVDHTEMEVSTTGHFDTHLYATRLDCAKRHLGWRGLTMPSQATQLEAITPRRRRAADRAPSAPLVEQPDLFADAPAPSPYHAAALGLVERLKAQQAAPRVE